MTYDEFVQRCSAAGRSPSSIADSAGLTRTIISRWKQGKNTPSPGSMLKLETTLTNIENSTLGSAVVSCKMPCKVMTNEIDFIYQILSDKNRHKLLAYAYELYEEDLPKWPYKLDNGEPYIPVDDDEKP